MFDMEIVPTDQTDNVSNQVGESTIGTTNSEDKQAQVVSGSDASDQIATTTNNSAPTSSIATIDGKPTLPLLVPSLKGKMSYVGGNVTCKGFWGMSDFAHTQPGQVSEFEFKLVKADEDSTLFPVNGRYQGWFSLKQAPPLKGSVKIEDKEMMFKFTRSDDDTHYNINGSGLNKFGSFTLKGTLSEEGDLHVYREYYTLTPAPSHLKRRLSIDNSNEDGSRNKKKSTLTVKTDDAVPPPVEVSPREGAGRVRKHSIAMQEYIETAATVVKPTVNTPKTPKLERETSNKTPRNSNPSSGSKQPAAIKQTSSTTAAPLIRQESTSDRSHRLPGPIKKCADLLKEMSKHPHCVWFLDPVDHVRLNIPDYPSIITSPMDFSTIRKRIEENLYDTVESFADDMRLVFRNAITFNTARDNPVHIAAREMSNRFEDRFRVLLTQVNGGINAYSSAVGLALEQPKSNTTTGKKSKTPRSSIGSSVIKPPGGLGPRMSSSSAIPYLPPAVDGSSAHQLMEMQRMMLAMQNEISSLKSQVRENEIVKRLQETKDASHNPLTFEEKKTLIAQIHKLPSDKMPHVLNIIQSALPPRENEDEGDIEVPLDALDTFTLRKLQKFIEENNEKKKRAPSTAVRNSTGGSSGSAPKRVRKSTSSNNTAAAAAASAYNTMHQSHTDTGLDLGGHDAEDIQLFEPDSEDMLFEPDSFEELKAHAQTTQHHQQHQQHSSNTDNTNSSNNNRNDMNNTGEDDDEAEDFSSLMNINQQNNSTSSGNNITMNNLDAWK